MPRATRYLPWAFAWLLSQATWASPQSPPAPAPSPPAEPAWHERVKVSGLLFGDFYLLASHPDSSIEGQSGFWIRRGFLTFDASIAKQWTFRLRFEINSPGDFKSQAILEPYVKDAFLARKFETFELQAGIIPTPTWELTESFWGYRSVERTPTDLYRLGAAREFGVGGKWSTAQGRFKLHGTIGNGAGIGSETDKGKKVAVAASLFPSEAVALELYGETEDRPGRADRTTYHVFAGYRAKSQRYGLEWVEQRRETPRGAIEIGVLSAFGVWKLGERAHLLLRADRALDPNPEGDRIAYLVLSRQHPFDFYLFGFDWKLAPKLHLIPSFQAVRYRSEQGLVTPDDVAVARVTLFVQF